MWLLILNMRLFFWEKLTWVGTYVRLSVPHNIIPTGIKMFFSWSEGQRTPPANHRLLVSVNTQSAKDNPSPNPSIQRKKRYLSYSLTAITHHPSTEDSLQILLLLLLFQQSLAILLFSTFANLEPNINLKKELSSWVAKALLPWTVNSCRFIRRLPIWTTRNKTTSITTRRFRSVMTLSPPCLRKTGTR